MTGQTPPLPSEANPVLSSEQWSRVSQFGSTELFETGEVFFTVGDSDPDMIFIAEGSVDVIRDANMDAPAAVVAHHEAGEFLGELNMLTNQAVFLTARAMTSGRAQRLSPQDFRRLMAFDGEIGDLFLNAFLARRTLLLDAAAASIQIVGQEGSAASLALRSYVQRMQLPHQWIGDDTPLGLDLRGRFGQDEALLPLVVIRNDVIRHVTPDSLAQVVGHTYRGNDDDEVDLFVIGGGPGGMAAAVYGASEGLRTVCVDGVGPGGQAAASSRVENYLGFPGGLSGADLTTRAATQALKFGARLYAPCLVSRLLPSANGIRVHLSDDTEILTRAVVIATGAEYRRLPIERWEEFEGAGIYFAATELEARMCAGRRVTVVGGANSAGQAALFLVSRGCDVDLVVRGSDLSAGMSDYLVQRLRAHPAVSIHLVTEVATLHGDRSLEAVTLKSAAGERWTPSAALFCFIGAVPATSWLSDIELDESGFVLTDVELQRPAGAATNIGPAAYPLPFETSMPRVFAAGDVRRGSMKRVAAAVGEGASAIASVHRRISLVG
ncbi:FAD-dependent oxidoreductase [Herbiconiux sp. CPCC 205763]|uniref:FAD-dependent oxidoreductase n=1 Tax=Herbiconiux aconitum TaxID=2970913 RepID=A0ABT2GS48_9MICO|nr:FAD-dependent oxidoreductase [Herbiconiux aconitum]MCS5717739.1 FAD-dependent oxidoreductase [Herbiconiux aconitum]